MTQKLWVFKSFDKERSFRGNEGYANEAELAYVYDTTVINHNRVQPGDITVIINKKFVTGIATIARIEVEDNVSKTQYSCPECGTKRHASRKKVIPQYRCRNKHEFDKPVMNTILVSQYKAIYSTNYKSVDENISASVLGKYYLSYNAYYSIQSASLSFLTNYFSDFFPATASTISVDLDISYIPSVTDSRLYRLIRETIRPDQVKFRQQLIHLHGASCMISDCETLEAIDACHISPYMGLQDNHLRNGLLLRKDLHALFDADLLGIEPSSLKIRISPILRKTSYQHFDGCSLKINKVTNQPSLLALKLRWAVFKENKKLLKYTSGQISSYLET